MDHPATFPLLTASKLHGVGARTLSRIAREIRQWGAGTDPERVVRSDPRVAQALSETGALEAATRLARADLQAARAQGASILCELDDAYPALLRPVPDRPALLYVLGALRGQDPRNVAVVGTQEPTRDGQRTAARIAGRYALEGWSVVSGLALGIDAAAHTAALEAGGHTVAVLAHGLDTLSPPRHRELAQRIVAAGGALLSEYPYGTAPLRPQFVQRDRLQAGLSLGVILIQSSEDGGSLHAARAALRYGRLLAYPQPSAADAAQGGRAVQATLRLLGGVDLESYLKCDARALQRVFRIRGREDYPELDRRLLALTPR